MSDHQYQSVPPVYHDYAAEAKENIPFSIPQPLPPPKADPANSALAFMTMDDQLDAIQNKLKTPYYAYDRVVPISIAGRYMKGYGHSGYIGSDSENFNAVRQSTASKWMNGTAKFFGNALSTAVSGTVGFVDGIGEMVASPLTEGKFDFSKFYDNFTDQKMQDLQGWQEEIFPNFRTTKEQNAPLWSTDHWATANFLADGFLKNLGFAAGALVTGELGGLALAKLPEITEFALAARNGLSTGRYAKDFRNLEQALSYMGNVDDVSRANIIRELLVDPAKLDGIGISAQSVARAGIAETKFKSAFNSAFISTMGAIGESSMEAIQGIQTIRQNLTDDYRKTHNGQNPDVQTQQMIEQRAKEGANWRWWLNLATLSITNNIQFPRLLSNGVKNQMGAFEREIKDIVAIDAEDKIVGKIARQDLKQTYADKAVIQAKEQSKWMKIMNPVYQFAKGIVKNPIAVSEAVEEGLQYTYEKGTESYEQMKFDGNATSLLHELIYTGIPATFHDDEGIESMIFGGLSGKVMDFILGAGERSRLKANTDQALTVFNNPLASVSSGVAKDAQFESDVRRSASPYIEKMIEASIRHQAITTEHNKAVAKGDVNQMRNLDADFIINMAMPKLTYGRKDVFKEELRQYHSSNMPFEEARQALGLTEDVTSEDLDRGIERRVKQVDQIDTLRTFVTGTLGAIDPKTGKPKYEQNTLDEMLYSLFKIDMHDERHDKLIQQIQAATGVDMSPLDSYYKRKKAGVQEDGIEGYKDLDTIRNEITKQVKEVVRQNPKLEKDNNGISIFDKLHDIETIQNDRETYVRDYYKNRENTVTAEPLPIGITDRKSLEHTEENLQYEKLVGQVKDSTTARGLAAKMSIALKYIEDGNLDRVYNVLTQIETMVGKPGSFLYQDSIKQLRQLTSTIQDKIFDKAKRSVPVPDPAIEGFDVLNREKALEVINKALAGRNAENAAADFYEEQGIPFTPKYTPEQYEYMEAVKAAYDEQSKVINRMDAALKALDNPEPVTPPISKIKRDIADEMMASYDFLKEKIDNPSFTEEDDLTDLLNQLQQMKEWYKDRKELLATKAFAGFMDLLDKRIADVTDWQKIVSKRKEDILRDDRGYYYDRTNNNWRALGINIAEGGSHIDNKELYDHVVAIAGEDVVLKAIADYQKAYYNHTKDVKADPDFEKHLLGLAELIRKAPASTHRTAITDKLQEQLQNPIDYLTDNDFKALTGPLEMPYDELIHNYRNGLESILIYFFNDPKTGDNAWSRYQRHGNLNRFSAEVLNDIQEGKFDYGSKSSEWTKNIMEILTDAEAAHNMMAMLNGERSLTDLYTGLRQTIRDEQVAKRPTPSAKQLVSVMDILLHEYNKKISPTEPFDPIIYLNGRIGTGKTSMASIILRTLGKLEGKDISKISLLAGDTARVGRNLERVIDMPQSGDTGRSIEDIIQYLDGATNLIDPKLLRFIVIDEAARAFDSIDQLAHSLQKFNKRNDQNVRIILLGDTNQVTGIWGREGKLTLKPNIHVATNLTTPFRGKVSSINAMNQDFLNAGNRDISQTPLTYTANIDTPWEPLAVEAAGTRLIGVSGSLPNTSPQQRIDMALKVMATRKGATLDGRILKKAVIVNIGSEPEWASRLKLAGLEGEFEVVSYFDAQGETYDEAYVDMHFDPKDKYIDKMSLFNAAMYAAGRARSFLYLISQPVITKPDVNLVDRFFSNTQALNDESTIQMNKVTGIAEHLIAISPSTIKETVPAKEVKKKEQTPEEKAKEETARKQAEEEAKKKAQAEAEEKAKKEAAKKKAETDHATRLAAIEERRKEELEELDKNLSPDVTGDFKIRRDQDLARINDKYDKEIEELNKQAAEAKAEADRKEAEEEAKKKAAAEEEKKKAAAATSQKAKEALKSKIHDTADQAGIPWDNDKAFMDKSEELTGKRHLDDMTEEELNKVLDHITAEIIAKKKDTDEENEEEEDQLGDQTEYPSDPEQKDDEGTANDDEYIPVLEKGGTVVEEPEQKPDDGPAPIRIGLNNFFVSKDGRIGITLKYPQGSALKTYNNITLETDGPEGRILTPEVGQEIFVMSMPAEMGRTKYGIFRPTGYEEVFQLMGVLSDPEVQELSTYIPPFVAYNEAMKAENMNPELAAKGGHFGMVQLADEDFQHLVPTGESNDFYQFNSFSGRPTIPGYLAGTIEDVSRLEYKRDPTKEASLKNDNAPHHGIDWLPEDLLSKIEGTPTEPGLLEMWHKSMFPKDSSGNFIIPGSPEFAYLKRHARISIITIDEKRLQEVYKHYSPQTSPVGNTTGGTYLVIENIPGYKKPQYIPLNGAVLNNNASLHMDMYINPIRKFIDHAAVLTEAVNKFISEEMSENPEEFEQLWKGNRYSMKDSKGNDLVFRRDIPDAFDTSSEAFNFLVKRLINMNWEDSSTLSEKELRNVREKQLGDNNKLNDPYVSALVGFYDRFFARLRELHVDDQMSDLARKLRLSQKRQEFETEDEKLTEEEITAGKKPEKVPVTITYSNGAPANKINLDAIRKESKEQTGERTAQVAMMQFAQANGSMTDPATGQHISILEMRKEVKKDNETSGRKERIVRDSYDLLRSSFAHASVFKKVGDRMIPHPDRYYITYGYDAQKAINSAEDPLHVNVYQLKQLLTFMINSNAYTQLMKANPAYEVYRHEKGPDRIYRDGVQFLQGKTADSTGDALMRELVEAAMAQYRTAPLGIDTLRSIFGEGGFNEEGEHKTKLRVNVPLQLSRDGAGVRWESPQNKDSSSPLANISPQERVGQMLSSDVTGIEPTNVSVAVNSSAGVNHVEPHIPSAIEAMPADPGTEEPFIPASVVSTDVSEEEREPVKQTNVEEKIIVVDPEEEDEEESTTGYDDEISDDDIHGGEAFFSGDHTDEELDQASARAYLRKMVPGIDETVIRFLDQAAILKLFGKDVWGAVRNGAIAFQTTARDTVYKSVVKHEAFHTIFRYFTGTADRNRILNAAIHHYGLTDTNPYKVEEFLAEEFHRREDESGLPSIIKSFFNWLRKIFGVVTQYHNDIEDYFGKIERGDFIKPVGDPLLGAAFMSRFERDYGGNIRLYDAAWTTFGNDFAAWTNEGIKVKEGDREYSIPLGDDEVLTKMRALYRKNNITLLAAADMNALTEEDRKKLNITDEEKFDMSRLVYGKLSNEDIFSNMRDAHFPDKFKAKKKTKLNEDPNYENQATSREATTEKTGNDKPVGESQEEESREDESVSMDASIRSDNEIDVRNTLSDLVHMYLHSISDNEGRPVDIESSFYFLYNAIDNYPMDAANPIKSLTSRRIVLAELEKGFNKFIDLEVTKKPRAITTSVTNLAKLRTKYASVTKIKTQEKIADEIVKNLTEIKTYYKEETAAIKTPNIRYSMETIVADITAVHDIIKDDLKTIENREKREAIVKDSLMLVEGYVKDMSLSEARGNPKAIALYDSLRRLIIDAYATSYIVRGRGVVPFKGDRAFLSDNMFIYKGHKIRRNKVKTKEGKQRWQTNYEFMKSITDFVKDRGQRGDEDFYLDDLIAIWRQRRSYHTLDDIMGVVNTSYTTKPFRFSIEEKNNEQDQKIKNISLDDIEETFKREIMLGIEDKIRVTDPDGTVRFDKEALPLSFARFNSNKEVSDQNLVTTFYHETRGATKQLSFSEQRLKDATEGVREILTRIKAILDNPNQNAETFDIEDDLFNDARSFTGKVVAPLIDTETDLNMSSYKNGKGDFVSGRRNRSHSDNVVDHISKYQGASKKYRDTGIAEAILRYNAPYLIDKVTLNNAQVAFMQLNPLNPFYMLGGDTRILMDEPRVFDSHTSKDWSGTAWVTTYADESRKDTLGRLFTCNFMAALNQPNLFPTRKESGGRSKIFTIQAFYVTEQKTRSQAVDMEQISSWGKEGDDHIANMLFQTMNRPLPEYEDTIKDINGKVIGKVKPYDNQKYKPFFSSFKYIKSTHLNTLHKSYEDRIQAALRAQDTDRNNNKLSDLFEDFKKDSTVQQHIADIKRELEEEARDASNFVIQSVRRNSKYKRKDEKSEIQQQPYKPLAFKLPSKSMLSVAYARLLTAGLISPEEITAMSKGLVTVDVVDDKNVVTIHDYSANIWNTNIQAEHLLPLMMNFTFNHFIRGLYLNQLTIGDNSVFGSHQAITKRMNSAHGSGSAFYNSNNFLRSSYRTDRQRDEMKFLVTKDVIRYRNLSLPLTNETYKPELYNKEEKGITTDKAYEIVKALEDKSQLSKPQYDNLIKAYEHLFKSGESIPDLTGRFQALNFSKGKSIVNDSAGWVTERAHDKLRLISGPGRNVQDLMKPTVMGTDEYGVNRPSKYAVEKISDNLAAKFPAMFDIRFEADFGYLNRSHVPEMKKMYDRAFVLERKRVNLVFKSENKHDPTLLEPEEEQELNDIYDSPLNRPAHMIVPESAVKFNCPNANGLANYNYVTESFDPVNHDTASFAVTMRDVRIQQDPVSDPAHSTVSLFTQLMYMSNSNGFNTAEMEQLFNTFSEIQRINFDGINEQFPMERTEGTMANASEMRGNRRSLVNMMIKYYKDQPAYEHELELLKESLGAVDDPSLADKLFTQRMSIIRNATVGHRFPGMKLIHITPLLRRVAIKPTDSREFKRTGFKEPIYNKITQTAEVYLPNIYLKQMQEMFPGVTDIVELIKRIPISFGFRVPSTGLNSAIRIKVKGFYPSKVNAIIAPADCNLIMGSDFDLDSLFVVNPSYATKKKSTKAFRDELNKVYQKLYGTDYDHKPIGFDVVETKAGYELEPRKGFADHIQSEYNKSADNDRKELLRRIYEGYLDNNMLHQYVKILGKEQNGKDIFYPINFETAKSMTDPESLFNRRAFALDPEYKKAWTEAFKAGRLFNEEDEETGRITDLRDKLLTQGYNSNTPMGMTDIQMDSMGSLSLVGIEASSTRLSAYAMYAVNKDQVMHVEDEDAVEYNGKSYKQIGRRREDGSYEIKLDNGKNFFEVMQWIVNAALDAVKEGITPIMNLTRFTANAWNAGLMLGMSESTLQSFMNIPVLREISDYPKRRGAVLSETFRIMRRELMVMYDMGYHGSEEEEAAFKGPNDRLYNLYNSYDEMSSEDFNNKVDKYTGDIQLTDELSSKYEAFRTLEEAQRKLSREEFSDFVSYNLKALEAFQKLDKIGDGFFKLMMALKITKDPNIKYGEFQNFLDNVYDIYETQGEMIQVTHPIDKDAPPRATETYNKKLIIAPNGLPQVKDSFPIKNINLFNIPHFSTPFYIFKGEYEKIKSTELKHHPVIEHTAIAISKQFGLKAEKGERMTDQVENIKNNIIGYLMGMVDFVNSDGSRTPLNAENQKAVKVRAMEFTGAQAFMQGFIDEIQRKRTSPKYQDNKFMGRLKIQNGLNGVRRLGCRKLAGLDENHLESYRKSFLELDSEERAKRNDPPGSPYWYSPLQIDFLKYAIMDNQLVDSSSNFCKILPTQMRAQVTDSLFHIVTAFMSYNNTTVTERSVVDDEGKLKEVSVLNNKMVQHIAANVGLKVVLNNPSLIPSINTKDNNEYLRSLDEESKLLAEDEEKEGREPKPMYGLKYNSRDKVYYHVRQRAPAKGNIDDRYRPVVKNRSYFNRNRYEVFLRVFAEKEAATKYKPEEFVAYYTRIGVLDNMKAMPAQKDVIMYGYDLEEMFPSDWPRFQTRDTKGNYLYSEIDLEPGETNVMIADDKDYLMESARVYRIAEKVNEPDLSRITEIEGQMRELMNNNDSFDNNFKKRMKLVNERRENYGKYRLEEINPNTKGVIAVKKARQTFTDGAVIEARIIENLLLDRSNAVSLRLEEAGLDNTKFTNAEATAAAQALNNGQINGECK